jgi:hypothetical protein
VRPQQQRVRELVALDVLGLRADGREVVQLPESGAMTRG